MRKVYKTLCAILLSISMVSTTAVFAEETTPTPTPSATVEVVTEEAETPTEGVTSTLGENATAFINDVNEAETNRDNILNAAQEYVDAYVASFDAEGEEATAAADALIVEKEDAFFGLFDQGALLDAYDALSEDEKNNEEVINAKALLDALIGDVDTIMNVEEPTDEPTTYANGVTEGLAGGVPTVIDLSTVDGDILISANGLYTGGTASRPGQSYTYNYSAGNLVEAFNANGYELTGTSTNKTIVVDPITKPVTTLIFNGIDMTMSASTLKSAIVTTHTDTTIVIKAGTTNSIETNGQNSNSICIEKNGIDGKLTIKTDDDSNNGYLNLQAKGRHSGTINALWSSNSPGNYYYNVRPEETIEASFTNFYLLSGSLDIQAGNSHMPGIGAGCHGNGDNVVKYAGDIYILGGELNTVGGEACSGIGSGGGTPVDGIYISGGAQVHATGGLYSPGIGSGGQTAEFNGVGADFSVNDIKISGGETHVWAIGDHGTNMPGIGCGKAWNDQYGLTRTLTNVIASPQVPIWATYIKYGTSETSYKFTTDVDVNGAGESLATPISADREFATFLQAKSEDGVNVYYTEVYFGLPHDEFDATDKSDIGASNYSTCAGSFNWADTSAAKTQLLSLAKVSGHDQNGNLLSETDILNNIAANATAQATFDNQIQAIFDANANNASGNYLLTFEFNYVDNNDHTNKTMKVSTHIQFRDACTPSLGGAAPVIAANNAIHPTGGAAWTKAELIGLTEGTASNYLGLDVDLLTDITISTAEMNAINAAKVASETGTFPLTYTYVTTTDGTTPTTLTKTVTVTLNDVGFPFNPKETAHPEKGQNMGPQFGANHFISKTGGSAFTPEQIKLVTSVSAKDSYGTSLPLTSLTPDATQLAAINTAKTSGQVGDFPLKFTFTDAGGTVRTITVTVYLRDEGIDGTTLTPTTTVRKDPTDSSSPIIRYEISGYQTGSNNHATSTGGAGWTDVEIKDLLEVVGDTSKGVEINRTDFTVDSADLNLLNRHKQEGLCGRYPIKFTGPNGEAITSYVTLTGCPVPPPTSKPIPGPFLVTYLDCYGNTVKVEWVNYGGSSTKPNNNYPDIVNVSENKEVRPNNCAYNVPNTGV